MLYEPALNHDIFMPLLASCSSLMTRYYYVVAQVKYFILLCVQGRFYFGELLEDDAGCDEDISAVKISAHSFLLHLGETKRKSYTTYASICLSSWLLFSCMRVLQKWLLLRLGCL